MIWMVYSNLINRGTDYCNSLSVGKYTKFLITTKQKQEKDPIYGPRIPIYKRKTANQVFQLS